MRVGTICYATEQGIGHLPKDFYDAGVITDVMVFRHGSRPTRTEWYPPGTVELVGRPFGGPVVDDFLRRVDVMFFVESPFDWGFLGYCRDRGVKTVVMPMYECTPVRRPHEPDRWACPSKLDLDYFPGSPYVPVPVPDRVRLGWRQRTRIRRWLHNGGNLGLRGHKGTLEILQAMSFVKSDIEILVRAQDTAGLRKLVDRCPGVLEDRRVTISYDPVPYDRLFPAEYDAFIMAEKYNGLSLPLAEARASGMLVVTSDRFPMNDWLPREHLIPVAGYTRERVGGPYNVYDEAHVRPEDIAATIDRLHGLNVTEYSRSGREWAEEHSWSRLKARWLEVLTF